MRSKLDRVILGVVLICVTVSAIMILAWLITTLNVQVSR